MKKWISFYRTLVSVVLMLSTQLVLAADPSKYFGGDSLVLAKAIRAGRVETIQNLSEDLNLNQVHNNDMTLLAYAMLVKQSKAIKQLVLAGADPLQYTEGLGQPLVIAASGKAEFLKAFLDAGVDPNSRDRWGMPILFMTLDSKNDDKVKLLIDYGVNLEIRSQRTSRGALDHAFTGLNYDRVEYLIKQGLNNFLVENVNGLSFAYLLQEELDHQSQDQSTAAFKKLLTLKTLLQDRGVEFPIAPSEKLRRHREKMKK